MKIKYNNQEFILPQLGIDLGEEFVITLNSVDQNNRYESWPNSWCDLLDNTQKIQYIKIEYFVRHLSILDFCYPIQKDKILWEHPFENCSLILSDKIVNFCDKMINMRAFL